MQPYSNPQLKKKKKIREVLDVYTLCAFCRDKQHSQIPKKKKKKKMGICVIRPAPYIIYLNSDLNGYSGKVKVLDNYFWHVILSILNTVYYLKDWNSLS